MKQISTAIALSAALFGGAATAATVSLTGGTPVIAIAPGSPVGQDFVPHLLATGATHLYSGPLSLTATEAVRVTFSVVGAESGYSNALMYDGTRVVRETVGNTAVDFTTGILNGETYSTVFAGGDLASLLTFDINNDGVSDFGSSDDEFGVFANAADIGNLSLFFLGLDDSGANHDDDHDDIIVRVEVSAVPLPAGGLLLVGGIAGLAALRRFRKS